MNKNFTPQNLVKFLYNETDDIENFIIENELKCNSNANQEYLNMKSIKDLMSPDEEQPSDNIINNILSYAHALNVVKLDNKHDATLILN